MVQLAASAIVAFLLGPLQPAAAPHLELAADEFPPQDLAVWMRERNGRLARLAARRLAEAPDSPETVRLLAQAENMDGAIQALRLIVDSQPRRIADAFEALGDSIFRFRGNSEQARRRQEALRQVVADARKRLPEIAREDAARAERVFILLDAERDPDGRNAWPARLARFIEQYRGTEAALLAEVDVITTGRVSQRMFDDLDRFIAAHPGTTAAAKALYSKGFQWHTINTLGTLEPRNADPTGRFKRVLAIVGDLESGRYPASEWTARAPALITGFFIPSTARIAPENVDRFIDAYVEFARARFSLHEEQPGGSSLVHLVTSKLPDLFAMKGERLGAMERVLGDLERQVEDKAAVRYLRGLFYMQQINASRSTPAGPERHTPEARRALLAKTIQVLADLSEEGGALYHRKALATLAVLQFSEGDSRAARASFAKYAASYPSSDWAWVALVRAGQCEEDLGNVEAAAERYLEAAARYPGSPLARVLGNEYAARVLEAAGKAAEALAARERALAGWDNAYGQRLTLYMPRPARREGPFAGASDGSDVLKESLPPRIAQMKRSLSLPGGAMLEHGRALLSRGRHQEAIAELQRVIAGHPSSPAVPEARQLARGARLERALTLAGVEQPGADEAEALREFEALAADPPDFAATAAAIARASLLWKQGRADAAEKLMTGALTAWHAAQRDSTPAAGLEEDVAAIRRAVFLPRGGEIYGSGRWNAFRWDESRAPFMLVNADVTVKLHGGEVSRVTLVQPLAADARVLFFDTEQIRALERILVKLGGTRTREPGHVMETPNQPVGDSMQILRLWTKSFPARPGHWGGWEIQTYPVVTEIAFTNAERTKASARVTIGYSGATVELEKEGGAWIAKRLSNQWIT